MNNITDRRVDRYRSRAGTVTFKGIPGVPVALPAISQPCERFVRASNH